MKSKYTLTSWESFWWPHSKWLPKKKLKRHQYSVCRVIREHEEDLKHDPERLSVKFMKKIIGVGCNGL